MIFLGLYLTSDSIYMTGFHTQKILKRLMRPQRSKRLIINVIHSINKFSPAGISSEKLALKFKFDSDWNL